MLLIAFISNHSKHHIHLHGFLLNDKKKKTFILDFQIRVFYFEYFRITFKRLFLKGIITFFIAVLMLMQSLSQLFIYLNFQMNREYIAKNLCENRKKPKSCCKGKCYLKKQLAKQAKQEKAQILLKEKFEIIAQGKSLFHFKMYALLQLQNFRFVLKKYSPPPFSIFHPPCAA